MFVSINGQRQMSFQQFAKTFREAFEREMTTQEWLLFSQNDFSDREFHSSSMFAEDVVLGEHAQLQRHLE